MAAVDAAWSWVALSLVPEIGGDARRYHGLLRLGAPADVLRASPRSLAPVVGEAAAAAIRALDVEAAVASQREAARRAAARLVTLADPDYPAGLRSSDLPPPFLFVRGTLAREDALAMAIVGSRRASPYGERAAFTLARDLAARGVTVVSGFARGIDGAAHRGALSAGGRTLAVLGSGVDVVYPPEHARLVDPVVRGGAVLSQFPMGTRPLPQHFPQRNRLLAALALGTVVVEAATKSGALITARCAGELGREVYAVPGNVSSPVSDGANALIQDGAKLVRTWEDVVAEWPPVWRRALRPVGAAGRPETGGVPEGDEPPRATEAQLLTLMGDRPIGIDDVIARSGLPSGQVAASLMTLELRGLVRQLPGQRYVRG